MIEGFGIRLRPVELEDAEFIVRLRNSPQALGNIGDSATSIEQQEAWIGRYFLRDGDYYFIIESASGEKFGTYGIYDVEGKSCEGGRWVVAPNVPAAIPSIVLALDLAFGALALDEVRGTVVSTNKKVLSLDCKIGFDVVGISRGEKIIGEKAVDIVNLLMLAKDWQRKREKLAPLAELAGELIAKNKTGGKNDY